MYQQKNIGLTNFKKFLIIWLVIIGIIGLSATITGAWIYWWQKSVVAKEREQLLLKIYNLQNEIKTMKENEKTINNNPKSRSKLPKKPDNKDNVYQEKLAGLEQKVIQAFKNMDMETLAKYVHPEKGLRFSPYSYVDPENDLVFSATRVKKLFQNNSEYIWGYYDENGLAMKLTPKDYFKLYINDRDFADSAEIGYNQTVSRGLNAGNIFEIYPKAIIVEYHVSRNDSSDEPMDWRNLKLVFEESANSWYVVGIVHDQWKI